MPKTASFKLRNGSMDRFGWNSEIHKDTGTSFFPCFVEVCIANGKSLGSPVGNKTSDRFEFSISCWRFKLIHKKLAATSISACKAKNCWFGIVWFGFKLDENCSLTFDKPWVFLIHTVKLHFTCDQGYKLIGFSLLTFRAILLKSIFTISIPIIYRYIIHWPKSNCQFRKNIWPSNIFTMYLYPWQCFQ